MYLFCCCNWGVLVLRVSFYAPVNQQPAAAWRHSNTTKTLSIYRTPYTRWPHLCMWRGYLRDLICLAASDEVVFNYEVDDAAVLSHLNILVITQADISRFVGIELFDNHIGRCGQGGIFVTHESSRECLHLLEWQKVLLQEDANWIHKVSQPNVLPSDISWRYADCTSFQCGNIQYGVNPELRSAVYEDIGEDVRIFRDEVNFFPPGSILHGIIPLSSSIPWGEIHQLRIKHIDCCGVSWSGYRSHDRNRGGNDSSDDDGWGRQGILQGLPWVLW